LCDRYPEPAGTIPPVRVPLSAASATLAVVSAPTDRDDLLAFTGWQRPAWQKDAACKEFPHLSWFPERGETARRQIAICNGCLVRDECRQFAVESGDLGIWGATFDRERSRLRRGVQRAA
jgi:WhiB family redox-sensing transcriptional regulator